MNPKCQTGPTFDTFGARSADFTGSKMRRITRGEFIALLGGAAALPLAARAQQAAIPVIGYLNLGSPESDVSRLTGLRRGLNQTGYVEGRNLVIEYRWAANQADRLPTLSADLVQLQVTVIVAAGLLPALAAKAATPSIPIVFSVAADPVQFGLVASLNRPGGNLTGFNGFVGELGAKGLALLHELVPSTAQIHHASRRRAGSVAARGARAAAAAGDRVSQEHGGEWLRTSRNSAPPRPRRGRVRGGP